MAIFGVIFSTIFFTLSLILLGYHNHISISGLFILGSLLGSTDPVAVSVLLKEIGATIKVNMLLEGESLLNDGTSLILASFFIKMYENERVGFYKILMNIVSFLIGSPLIGLLIGYLFSLWIGRVIKDGVLIVSITFVSCFLVFLFCEYPPWNFSGILALVTSSIILSYKSKMRMVADRLYETVETIWKFV